MGSVGAEMNFAIKRHSSQRVHLLGALCIVLATVLVRQPQLAHAYDDSTLKVVLPSTAVNIGSPVLATDGQTAVWLERAQHDASSDIYGARLSDGQRFPIATSSDNEGDTGFGVDGDFAVWVETDAQGQGTVRALQLSSGETFEIAPAAYNTAASVSGNWVVWKHAIP